MTWLAKRFGKRGRPVTFSDAAIQVCLSVKVLFALPLRQTSGMVASLLMMAELDWPAPDFSTLSPRQKTLMVLIPYRRVDGPLNPSVPARALLRNTLPVNRQHRDQVPLRRQLAGSQAREQPQASIIARQANACIRREGRKGHLAMVTSTSDIRAVEFSPSRDGRSHGLQANHCRAVHSPVLPVLLDQIPEDEQIDTESADGVYDTRRCRAAIIARDAEAIIPVRRNGRLWKEDGPAAKGRNKTLRASQRFGRSLWKRWSGPHAQSRVEARMGCLKAFGERIMARDPDLQTAEIHIRIPLMNRFSALGTAEIGYDG